MKKYFKVRQSFLDALMLFLAAVNIFFGLYYGMPVVGAVGGLMLGMSISLITQRINERGYIDMLKADAELISALMSDNIKMVKALNDHNIKLDLKDNAPTHIAH